MPDPQPNRDLVTEILEMTVSIERTVFKTDGFPKAKLFQSAKAAVPRGVAPEAISATLQAFVLQEMDKFETGPQAPPPAQGAPAGSRQPAPAPAAQGQPQGQGKAQEPKQASPPSSSPPSPTETKPPASEAKKTSAKDSEAEPAPAASNPPDLHAKEVREKRVRGAYARRKHKEGGERCVQEILRQKGKEQIEDLDDKDLKVLLDALDKLAELDDRKGGGAWR